MSLCLSALFCSPAVTPVFFLASLSLILSACFSVPFLLLPAFLRSCLPSFPLSPTVVGHCLILGLFSCFCIPFLSAFFCSCKAAFLCLSFYFLPFSDPVSLFLYLHSCHPAASPSLCLPACFPVFLPVRLPQRLLVCLPVCLEALLPSFLLALRGPSS
jgi:hypothetical protein